MYLSKATKKKVMNLVKHQLLKRFARKFDRSSDFKIDEQTAQSLKNLKSAYDDLDEAELNNLVQLFEKRD